MSHSFFLSPIPVQALRVPGGGGGVGSLTSTQSAHEGGKVVRPTHRPTLPHQYTFLVIVSLSGWVDHMVIGLCQWKIPVEISGIETATFRLVAQWLNQLHHCLLLCNVISVIKTRRRKLIVFEAYGNQGLTKKFYPEYLKRIWGCKELGIMMWIESIWLRVGASGVQLYTRQVEISYKDQNI
jgi:hypothetical protein